MSSPRLSYRRNRFSTRLPTDRVYTEGHFWIAPEETGVQRVGFTRFATRMLGEMVEYDFETKPGAKVEIGEPVGWIEGFKAVTDLYAPLDGVFVEQNSELDEILPRIHKSPYDDGWLYRVQGDPPSDTIAAKDYAEILDGTINRMLGEND